MKLSRIYNLTCYENCDEGVEPRVVIENVRWAIDAWELSVLGELLFKNCFSKLLLGSLQPEEWYNGYVEV